MPKMGVNPEETKAAKPVPAGWYKVKVKALTAKLSGSKKGYNYVAFTEVVENTAENNGKFVPIQMNNGFNLAKYSNDFTHGTGWELEKDGSFPGDWKLKDGNEKLPDDDISKNDGAQYSGPMLGRVMEVELAIEQYEGQDRNVVKQIRCAVKDCATKYPDIKHLTEWRGKKK